MARILIVEDDFAIRQSVEFMLRRAGHDVKSLDRGTGVRDVITSFAPDLIVLDLMLPGVSGYEITEALREDDLETAIIMISALSEDVDKVAGLTMGADDYLSKPFSMDELLARVNANLRRVRPKDSLKEQALIEAGDVIIDPQSFSVVVAGIPVHLRAKEFQLLYMLAANKGQLCTRDALAEEVWGYEHLTSSRTIDVHIRRLRAVVEDPSAFTYIHTIHGMGYRFDPQLKETSDGI